MEPNDMLTVAYPSKGRSFTFPKRYAEGDTLDANEANALNGLLCENIRNNFAKHADNEAGLSDEELNAKFAEYAENYDFAGRRQSTKAPVDPVAKEAHKIAAAKIDAALRAKGTSRKNLAEGKFEGLVAELIAKYPAITEEAQRRVESAKAIGTDSLAELLADAT